MTRQDVEAELARAKRADEESAGPIMEGQPYRSVEEGDPYLQGADLFGVDLSVLDLAEANLRDADLRETILDGTVLAGADLYRADLRRLMHNLSNQQIGQMTQRTTELEVEVLSAGIGCYLRR